MNTVLSFLKAAWDTLFLGHSVERQLKETAK